MHKIQRKILELSDEVNLNELGLRKLGALIGVEHPQNVKWHLEKLIRDGHLLSTVDGELVRASSHQAALTLINLPILGRANCGEPLHFAGEGGGEVVQVSRGLLPANKVNNCFAVRAVGDSMNRASINGQPLKDGDLAIVDASVEGPENDDYILVSIDNLATIKKFRADKARGRIYLIPESTLPIAPIVVDASDESAVRIHGRIIDIIPSLV